MLGKHQSIVQWAACFLLALGVGLVQWPRDGVNWEGLQSSHVQGFLAVLTACCTSGLAGVWIQKLLQNNTASIWMRNFQLGLFIGYNLKVMAVIAMTAGGGLLCAVMLKYAG